MVKKQVAQKSTGKHANVPQKGKKIMHAGSSSSKKGKIKEPALRTKDKAHLWKMQLLPERGYDLKKASASFMSTVANLNWDHFVLPRGGYIEDLVREFYAGITPQEGTEHSYTSMVRGKLVHFHPKKLNEHYMLKYNGTEFEKKVAKAFSKEMEELKGRIAIPDSVWEKFTPNEIKLRSTYLIDALGNWHLFIATSILPTSHTYAMTKERLILLDTILSEGNIDIGRLIAREILACTAKSKGFLFFPCLITELCMKEGVPIAPHEQRKFPPGNLNAEMRERLRKMTGPVPAPAMQEHHVQKQLAVWKFLNDQHDWLQLVFGKMSDNVGQVNAPEFPKWVFKTDGEEEEEKEAEEEEKEEEKEEEPSTKKKVTRKQAKGKKKVVVEPEIEELYDSDNEDEELEKEMDEEVEEEEESDDEVDSEEEERARGVILEEIARQKYAKPTPQAQ